mmetsp:Transcript_26079/g.39471  ORF Transcript_26079/g.39471 Transcript_26079/m.39471 type:complete len:487 (+) Transcript_26079:7-1467(+)
MKSKHTADMENRTIKSIIAFVVAILISTLSLLREIQTIENFSTNTTSKSAETVAVSLVENNIWNDTNGRHFNDATDDPPFTWSACMISRDETIVLPEWLAYHATMLPLERFILGLDPRSKMDPRPILREFQRELGVNWTVLEYDDYFKPGRREFQKYNYMRGRGGVLLDEEKQYKAHLWRQEVFYEKCIEILMKEPGRSWTLFIDADEFLAYNPPRPREEKIKSCSRDCFFQQLRTKLPITNPRTGLLTHKMISNVTENTVSPTMAHFLHRNYDSIVEAEPNYKAPCWGFTRLDFVATRDDKAPVGTIDFPSSMITLQFRFHNEHPRNRNGKCILNVAQLSKTQQEIDVANPHEILTFNCTNTPRDMHFEKAFFKIHHYATSLSHSLARGKSFEDFMSRQPQNTSVLIESYDGTWWWSKLVQRVGWRAAKNITVRLEAWALREYHRIYFNNTNETMVHNGTNDTTALLNLSSYKTIRFDLNGFVDG